MTAVIRAGAGRVLPLPGRTATELVSGAEGGYPVTVRRVSIPPGDAGLAGHARPAGPRRAPHRHADCTEVIVVLAGTGEFTAGTDSEPVGPGDVIVVSPGEPHLTRNTGTGELVTLCFFPVPDLAAVTTEAGGPPR
jgi:mannose-6-phosphate isomerase-like protein (cupin superfamily)